MTSLRYLLLLTFFSLLSGAVLAAPRLLPKGKPVKVAGPKKAGAATPKSKKTASASLAHLQPVAVVPAKDILHDHQPISLSGAVVDATGKPLPGATIWLTNTHQAVAVANASGEFMFSLPNSAPVSLSCGYAGYEQQTVLLTLPKQQETVSFALPVAARAGKH